MRAETRLVWLRIRHSAGSDGHGNETMNFKNDEEFDKVANINFTSTTMLYRVAFHSVSLCTLLKVVIFIVIM
jgi:hypothetical protein